MSKSAPPAAGPDAGNGNRKQEILEQVISLIEERVSARKGRFARNYVPAYFRRVAFDDLSRQPIGVLATVIENQLDFLLRRKPGELLLRVFNPTLGKDGWESEHTVIEMVNDDKPFLVDSANLVLAEMEIGVHLIIHPVIRVRRGPSGQLTAITDKDDEKGYSESFMQIQIDRETDESVLNRIRREMEASMREVRLAVADWKRMTAAAQSTVKALPEWAAGADDEVIEESQDFLSWLVDDHFTFLGMRDYEVAKVGKGHQLRIVEGSGLGIMREEGDEVTSRALGTLAEAVRSRRHEEPIIVTKTNARSRIHRVGYMDYVGVLRYDKKGYTIGRASLPWIVHIECLQHRHDANAPGQGQGERSIDTCGTGQGQPCLENHGAYP